MDQKGLWQAVLGELEVNITPASFATWFKNTSIIDTADGRVVVGVPNIFTKEWLEKKYHNDIKQALTKLGTNAAAVEYRVSKHAPTKAESLEFTTTTEQSPKSSTTQAEEPISDVMSGSDPGNDYRRNYTFDNFVVGSSNELAYAACGAVAKYPGTKYNPLFIYGGVGLGKTHLMQAVANEVLKNDPNKRVAYVTSETFTNEFLASLSRKRTQDFADKYRKVDVLIVDDIQFLASKERTQEEFFHTFNTLHQSNKQIILSSDKPPQALTGLEDRLKSRFASGMMADISAPDLETRSAILQRKAAAHGMLLPFEVIDFIARNVVSNIRELEGTLTQFMAHCEFHKLEPSLATANQLFGGRATKKAKPISAKAIIDKVAHYYDLSSSEITGSKRDKEIVRPRQIAMYIMRQDLSLSFPKIAVVVGGRDHTTAMHSVSKIEKQLEVDESLREEIQNIRGQLVGN